MQFRSLGVLAAILAVGAPLHEKAFASEAAMTRYAPGAFATPGAGIVPPVPGFYWNSTSVFYNGDANTTLNIPIAGQISSGLEATMVGTSLTGVWVPGWSLGEGATFAISTTIPLQHMEVKGSIGPLSRTDDSHVLGDIMLAPTLGWMSGTTFASLALRIYAPTGDYDENSLANIGLNYWTFSPTVSFTHLDVQNGLDFSLVAGLDINTKNDATDYHSGSVAHVDATLVKSLTPQFGIGIFGSALVQVTDDEGPLADRLDGFKGRAFAVGPVLKYTGGTKESPITATLSWAPEFETKNRLKGNGVYFAISGAF